MTDRYAPSPIGGQGSSRAGIWPVAGLSATLGARVPKHGVVTGHNTLSPIWG